MVHCLPSQQNLITVMYLLITVATVTFNKTKCVAMLSKGSY